MPPFALPRHLAVALALGLLACAGSSPRTPSEQRMEPAMVGARPEPSVTPGLAEPEAPRAERETTKPEPETTRAERETTKDEPETTKPEPGTTKADQELASPPAEAPPREPPIVIQKGTRVLMFGDSMVTSGLGVYLEERVRALGGTWSHISKPSSTTVSWADGHDLQELVTRARPDVVIIALVSNELFVPNPRARIYAIREIIKRVGARPCLWVGPPSWRPDKGIVAVVRETSSPCRFFDSAQLPLERQSDGIHPTLHGGRVWGEAVWQDAFAMISSP
jgi:hypothetical protein